MTLRLLCSLALAATTLLAQYKAEPAGATPAGVPDNYKQVLAVEGTRVTGPNGKVVEFWFVRQVPSGGATTEDPVAFKTVPHGALMAVVHFAIDGEDRRGQRIKAGLYTARHSLYPVNGAHQGVAPQRDFLVLAPLAGDANPAATPDYDTLMKMSLAASGTPHPAVFSYWKEDAKYYEGGVVDMGEGEWVLQVKVGDVPVSVIVAGAHVG